MFELNEIKTPQPKSHRWIQYLKSVFGEISVEEIIIELPTSVSGQHKLAIAELTINSSPETVTSYETTWVLATLPQLADIMVLSFFGDHPRAFCDAFAALDARLETDDSCTIGSVIPIHHSVVQQRGYNGVQLLGFANILPQIQLSESLHTSQQFTPREATKPITQPLREPVNCVIGYFINPEKMKLADTYGPKILFKQTLKNTQSLQDLTLPPRPLPIKNIKEAPSSAVNYEIDSFNTKSTSQHKTLANEATNSADADNKLAITEALQPPLASPQLPSDTKLANKEFNFSGPITHSILFVFIIGLAGLVYSVLFGPSTLNYQLQSFVATILDGIMTFFT